MDMSNALEAVQSFHSLAKDAINRGTLLKDATCPQFLAYALGENNLELVKLSLETLTLLADTQKHKLKLGSIFGVFPALQATAEKEELGEEINNAALSLLTDLKFARNSKAVKVATDTPRDTVPNIQTKNSYNNSRRSKIITLFIKGLETLEDRNRIEDDLIRVRGVISIVCDVVTHRATLRVREHIKPEQLHAKISADDPLLVVKLEDGTEVMKDLGKTEETVETVENLPEYLPEDDPPVSDKAVTKHPVGESAFSWLSSAAGFVKRSFYW
ncbi:armadillo repeat-containing protein 1-like [Artemia franciscana]|uniref:Armadillo repeat-containing protein 1 n=1 Tax=Artemia franciscana TaxID=6661 RepID=A0AA88HNN0_ARTSF|nr:hypothetical protein QYM36_014577 [Artemia franciscana]